MARYNPDVMMVDGEEQPRRVVGPRTDTTQVTAEDVKKQLDLAAVELGLDPRGAQFEETEIFAPVGGGAPVAGASEGDAEYFARNGFTAGPLPRKYQGIFGNDPNIIGWRVVSNPDGSKSIEVAIPQGDADGGLSFAGYGASFFEDNFGNVTAFDPTGNTKTGDSFTSVNKGTGSYNGVSTGSSTVGTSGLTSAQYNERMGVYASMADRFNK